MKTLPSTLLLLGALAAGCSKGSNDERSPVGPSSSTCVAGAWVGTLTRPDGSTMAARWQVTVASNGEFTGPMTLTNGEGFMNPPPQRTQVIENTRIHLTKQ